MKLLTRTKRTANDGDLVVRYRPPFTLDAEPSTGSGVDLHAVERALAGEHPPVRLTDPEARLAWSLLANEHEISASEIAELLGVSDRTVVRWRSSRPKGAVMKTQLARGERWQDRAYCRGIGTSYFFADGHVGTVARRMHRDAAQLCARCPVIEDCLEFALAAEGSSSAKDRSGVFGGLSPTERYTLHRARVQEPSEPIGATR